MAETKISKTEAHQFFQSNLAKLDESLLEAFPLVFAKLTANQTSKEQWNIAVLFSVFGAFIQEFPLGNRQLNLELSITASQLVLKIFTRKAFPEDWAATQNNLANAYSNRIRGERADNLEQAIAAYELALQVRTREAFPENWAATQNNLAIAYSDRIRGERADNLEQAIAAYELALQITTREAFPENWAETQHNLANVYREQILGERINNLEQALSAYELAAQVFTRDAYPYKWSINQSNLAETLTKRSELTENSQDLDTAITLLQSALEISPPGSPDFIDSQYRLGTALSRRYDRSQNPNDLEQALQAYETALDAISPEHYDRQKMWQALPATQSILGSRLISDGQWQEGLQLLLNSVNQLSTGSDRLAHANALFQTGRAHETLDDRDNARIYYRDALRLYQHLNDALGIAQSRAGLGSVLIAQGFLQKGMKELQIARDSYNQLGEGDRAAKIGDRYQAAEKAMKRQANEVYL
ncbi:tetratricopeptide repeat protein [Spirulina sp. 06S082]|uniref:tetratricopeptide repeat protein n=1 Tax=Spirulina sp. 06S082 TaxID=3110248 RepID=UPI002B1F9427|nr:tetratricopeptide repeat protein [Spirulina sp. 06S082]